MSRQHANQVERSLSEGSAIIADLMRDAVERAKLRSAVFAERVVALIGESKTHAARLPLLDPRSADEETMTLETTLKQWNADLLNDEYLQESVDRAFIDTGWLGRPPATEQEIGAAETRLGVRLPASYREFLLFANGWAYPGNDMDFPGHLRSCREIGWFKDEDADWIQAWIDTDPGISVSDDAYFVYGDDQDPVIMRRDHLASCLKISESSEGGVYLLNPNVLSPSGEWEAWHFSNVLPGATRCRTFGELIEQQHRLLKRYRGQS